MRRRGACRSYGPDAKLSGRSKSCWIPVCGPPWRRTAVTSRSTAFDRGIVYLHMQGACAGCPSSTLTLKMGIENLLAPLHSRSGRGAPGCRLTHWCWLSTHRPRIARPLCCLATGSLPRSGRNVEGQAERLMPLLEEVLAEAMSLVRSDRDRRRHRPGQFHRHPDFRRCRQGPRARPRRPGDWCLGAGGAGLWEDAAVRLGHRCAARRVLCPDRHG